MGGAALVGCAALWATYRLMKPSSSSDSTASEASSHSKSAWSFPSWFSSRGSSSESSKNSTTAQGVVGEVSSSLSAFAEQAVSSLWRIPGVVSGMLGVGEASNSSSSGSGTTSSGSLLSSVRAHSVQEQSSSSSVQGIGCSTSGVNVSGACSYALNAGVQSTCILVAHRISAPARISIYTLL